MFAFIAITFRMLNIIFYFDGYFDKTAWVMFAGATAPFAKLCVGFI